MTTALTEPIACECSGQRLTFSCDPLAHLVVVHGEDGAPCASFGGFGTEPGAFDTPIDLTLVQPEFYGEPYWQGGAAARYLAIADYGNARVQILDLNGVLMATLDDDVAAVGRPTRLHWRAPYLEVEGLEGARTRIHLASALIAYDVAREPVSRPTRTVSRASRLIC